MQYIELKTSAQKYNEGQIVSKVTINENIKITAPLIFSQFLCISKMCKSPLDRFQIQKKT